MPDGIFGSVYVDALRVSDSGLPNISGIDTYISTLFREFKMHIHDTYDQFPALYGDGIFLQLATIVTTYKKSHSDNSHTNLRTSSVRESIENLFALHTQIFESFSAAHRFQILLGGVQVVRLVFN